jgi:Ni,Fe-hydrogenase III small subunit
MRTLLLQGLLHQPLTDAAPRPEDVAAVALAAELNIQAQRRLGRSLSIRALDAGSCNGCELEMHALSNAFYDLERFGLKFVASPRHADVLFVTGPVTKNMREALERTHNAMPGPKWVVGVGDCAKDGGVFAKSYAVSGGVATVLPVDLYIPGCPPRPLDMLTALLRLLRQSHDDNVHGQCL